MPKVFFVSKFCIFGRMHIKSNLESKKAHFLEEPKLSNTEMPELEK